MPLKLCFNHLRPPRELFTARPPASGRALPQGTARGSSGPWPKPPQQHSRRPRGGTRAVLGAAPRREGPCGREEPDRPPVTNLAHGLSLCTRTEPGTGRGRACRALQPGERRPLAPLPARPGPAQEVPPPAPPPLRRLRRGLRGGAAAPMAAAALPAGTAGIGARIGTGVWTGRLPSPPAIPAGPSGARSPPLPPFPREAARASSPRVVAGRFHNAPPADGGGGDEGEGGNDLMG